MWVRVPPSVLKQRKGLRVTSLSPFFVGLSGLIFESVADRWLWVGVASRGSSPDARQMQCNLNVSRR